MIKYLLLIILTLSCNSKKPELSPIGKVSNPTPVDTKIFSLAVYVSSLVTPITIQNGTETISVTTEGAYVFSTKLALNDSYNVTIVSGSSNCNLTNGFGIATGDISDIRIQCSPPGTNYVQGFVQGVTSGQVLLRLTVDGNPVEQKTVMAGNTSYTFSNFYSAGGTYNVSILSQPAGLDCSLENASGILNGNQNNINLNCANDSTATYSVSGNITGLGGGSITLLYSSSELPSEETHSGASSFTKNGFVQGRRYVIEIKKTDSSHYCYFNSNKAHKQSATSSSNIADAHITCEPRTANSCEAFSGELPSTFSGVNTVHCENDQYYLLSPGVGFGKYLGGGFTFNIVDNTPTPPSTFDRIRGVVHTAIPDGLGGWYVGGDFTSTGEVATSNIVHLLPDLTVDTSFTPIFNGTVKALVKKGTFLYVGGTFTQVIQGTTVVNTKGLALLDLGTNPVALASLSLNINYADISHLALTDSSIIVGGNLRQLSGSSTVYMEKFPIASSSISILTNPFSSVSIPRKILTWKDPSTGSWYIVTGMGSLLNLIPEDGSPSISISGTTNEASWDLYENKIYYSNFNTGIKVFDLPSLSETPFPVLVKASSADVEVNQNTICLSASTININSGAIIKNGLACFDKSTGASIGNSSSIFSAQKITISEDKIFAHYFPRLNSESSRNIMRFNLATMESDLTFNPPAFSSAPTDFKVDGDDIYVIGGFTNVAGQSFADKLIRLNKADGALDTTFATVNTFASHTFNVLVVSSAYIYVLNSGKDLFQIDKSTYTLKTDGAGTPDIASMIVTDNFLWKTTYSPNGLIIQSEASFGTAYSSLTLSHNNYVYNFYPLSGDRAFFPNHRYPSASINNYVVTSSGSIDPGMGIGDFTASGYLYTNNSDNAVATKPGAYLLFLDLSPSYSNPAYSSTLILHSGNYGKLSRYENSIVGYGIESNDALATWPVWGHIKDTPPHVYMLKIQ